MRKAEKVFFGDNQGVPKDKVAQSRLGVEIFGFIDDFILRIRRIIDLLYRTKQTIHPDTPFASKRTPSYTHLTEVKLARSVLPDVPHHQSVKEAGLFPAPFGAGSRARKTPPTNKLHENGSGWV